MTDYTEVERSIWRAHPARLVDAALETIEAWLGTGGAEVLLIDYHQSHLLPFTSGEGGRPVPVDGHPAGQAYASCRTVPDEDRVYLPLSVYGERLGVLAVRLPPDSDARPEELAAVAGTLARAIVVANTATDIYREVRRRKRLTAAAEMQWELLPGRTCRSDEFSLAGQPEPAYAVSGDNFACSISPASLTLSVPNRMGSGIPAALLTQLALSSL